MAAIIDIDTARINRDPSVRNDRVHYNLVGLMDAEIHLCKVLFKFREAADIMEEGFAEIQFIRDPGLQASATHILVDNYMETRNEFRSVGCDLG